jgi:alkylated DNA nucleotide flippase Atl1
MVAGADFDEPTATRRLVASIVAEIPAGRWTSYGEVALVAGSYPQPVAAIITSNAMQGAWRVLQMGGTIAPGFRWLDPHRTEDPREYLAAEGLVFNDEGQAVPEQFLNAEELAELTGLEVERDRRSAPGTRPLLEQRRIFFEHVHDLGNATSARTKSWGNGTAKNYIDVRLGIAGAHIVLSATTREPAVHCSLYVQSDKALFARLYEHRDEIEAAIGGPLEWNGDLAQKSSTIGLHKDGDWRDEGSAAALAQWLVSAAEKFAEVFPGYL